MLLITLGYMNKSGERLSTIENWLYSGGVKRFLYNINKKLHYTMSYIISVEDLGDIDHEELQNMIQDGYRLMAMEEHKTLYK
jgi:hypothetical protein